MKGCQCHDYGIKFGLTYIVFSQISMVDMNDLTSRMWDISTFKKLI